MHDRRGIAKQAPRAKARRLGKKGGRTLCRKQIADPRGKTGKDLVAGDLIPGMENGVKWLREASFLLNNWVLLFAAFFVLFATMFIKATPIGGVGGGEQGHAAPLHSLSLRDDDGRRVVESACSGRTS